MHSEQRFTDRVDSYVKTRPNYPPGVVDFLTDEARLGPRSVIADIGSGTGISSEMFLRADFPVTAVEPNAAMREAAEQWLGAHAGYRSVAGMARATTLETDSVDLIIVAQAFHWFNTEETRAEFRRILRPGGKAALIGNERLLDATPFLRDYEALLVKYGTDYEAVRAKHDGIDAGSLALLFPGGHARREWDHAQRLDLPGLEGRILSSSYTPRPGSPGHEEMIATLRDLFAAHQSGGTVEIAYRTWAVCGAITAESNT